MMIVEIDGKKHEVDDEVASLLESVSRERDDLKDFAISMTVCGYDFANMTISARNEMNFSSSSNN
jgi:hypothetical protein